MKEQVARNVSALMLQSVSQLDKTVQIVKENCDKNEFSTYHKKVGNIMGQVYCDILTPIYDQYPNLMPDELKQ